MARVHSGVRKTIAALCDLLLLHSDVSAVLFVIAHFVEAERRASLRGGSGTHRGVLELTYTSSPLTFR